MQGDLEKSIRAYELGLTVIENCLIDMKATNSHELGFMYAISLDWKAAYRQFASLAGDSVWLKPFHYFMATGKCKQKIITINIFKKPVKNFVRV